ncbi:2-dehydropantoate 2-reductase N-terminal domain-containing protein, partial [uncultured Sphingomonas sp.]
MKIAVFGLGYVGMSNAVLLAQHNAVVAVDISEERVALVNDRKSPIVDAELERFLVERTLDLTATTDAAQALAGADYVIVATP